MREREREKGRERGRKEKKRARWRERGNGPLAHPTMKQSGPVQMEGEREGGQTFTLFTQVDYITELSLGDLLPVNRWKSGKRVSPSPVKVVFYPPHPSPHPRYFDGRPQRCLPEIETLTIHYAEPDVHIKEREGTSTTRTSQ